MKLAAAAAVLAAFVQAGSRAVLVTQEPRHHLEFENAYARVFDVVVPPSDATLFHLHPQDYVFVAIGDATLKSQVQGGPETDLRLGNGEVRFSKGPLTHRVINVGANPFHNVTVQLLRRGPGGTAANARQTPGSVVVIDNERVRVERIVLEPGQSIEAHTRTLPALRVTVSGGTLAIEGARPGTSQLKPADIAWQDAGPGPAIRNAGASRFEAIDICWK